jgi:hypothetical protein
VFEVNPGYVISPAIQGGMAYEEWKAGKQFAPGTEMRTLVCPRLWYQVADYFKAPQWDECHENLGGFVSDCKRYCNKAACWARWDAEHGIK